jgi:hypothetical protein
MRVRQHAITRAGLCIKINDHTQYDDLWATVLETIKGSTCGRKRYAYCATKFMVFPTTTPPKRAKLVVMRARTKTHKDTDNFLHGRR